MCYKAFKMLLLLLYFQFALMINLLKIILLSHLLFCTLCHGERSPQVGYAPQCQAAHYWSDFFISVQEVQNINLDNFFTGYNLNITIEELPSFAALSRKVSTKENISSNLDNMRQVNIRPDQNQNIDTIVVLREKDNSSLVAWGKAQSAEMLPNISSEIVVENDERITCLDAASINKDMIVVDCVKRNTFGNLENLFFFVNSTRKEVTKYVRDEMLVGYSEVRGRRIQYFPDSSAMIRVYFGDQVDSEHRKNTFAQLLLVTEHWEIKTINVIDRTFLEQVQLQIIDFQTQKGKLYILDALGVSVIDISAVDKPVLQGKFKTAVKNSKIAVQARYKEADVLMALVDNFTVTKYIWKRHPTQSPQVLDVFQVTAGSVIDKVELNSKLILVDVRSNLSKSAQKSTLVFNSAALNKKYIFAGIAHKTLRTHTYFNKLLSQLVVVEESALISYALSESVLTLAPIDPSLTSKSWQIRMRAVSKLEHSPSTQLICSLGVDLLVVPRDSLPIWLKNKYSTKYYAHQKGKTLSELDYILGSNITYGFEYNASHPKTSVLHQNEVVVDWGDKKISSESFSWVKTRQFKSINSNQFMVYTENNKLAYVSKCSFVPYEEGVHCYDNKELVFASAPILRFAVSRFMFMKTSDWLHLGAAVFNSMQGMIALLDLDNQQELLSWVIFNTKQGEVVEQVQLMDNYLFIVLKQSQKILIFDINTFNFQQTREIVNPDGFVIDVDMMSQYARNFRPMEVVFSDFHPKIFFIRCLDRVVAFQILGKELALWAIVLSPAISMGSQNWRFAVAKDHLVLAVPPKYMAEYYFRPTETRPVVQLLKEYEMFDFQLDETLTMKASENGTLVYLTAVETRLKVSAILIFKTGVPAVTSLFHVHNFKSRLYGSTLNVCGRQGDYVTVTYGAELMMFREYQNPALMFEDVTGGVYNFNLTFTNDPLSRYRYLQQSTVEEQFGSGVAKEKIFWQGRLTKKWKENMNLMTE